MTTTIIVAIVAVVVALLIAVPVTCKVAVNNKIQKDAEIVGTAEDKARSIIDEALKTAETKKREALLEVKEESLRTKNELEKETKERRNELQKYEKRVLSKEETVDKKAEAVEKREAECTARFAELQKKEKRVDELELKGVQELERVSGLTSEQAKEELLRSVEDDVKVDVAVHVGASSRASSGLHGAVVSCLAVLLQYDVNDAGASLGAEFCRRVVYHLNSLDALRRQLLKKRLPK